MSDPTFAVHVEGNAPNKQTVIDGFLALLITDPVVHDVNRLLSGDPKHTEGVQIGKLVTGIVGYLRDQFPNPNVNALAAVTWDLIGNWITPVGVGPAVDMVTFISNGYSPPAKGFIFLPHGWLGQYKADPIMQVGAFVFAGSQAMDYYNGRLIDGPNVVIPRGHVYEAEYLHAVARVTPDWKPNDYQREVMRRYPQGVGSHPCPPLYKSRPVIAIASGA